MPSKALTDTAKRTDMWFVDPYDIKILEDKRGRWTPPSPEAVIQKAVSMMNHGQLQAVEVRRAGKDVILVSGFTRAGAARLIRDGFEYEGQKYHDPKFMLQCRLVTLNEQEAFEHNIVENCHRDETSPIDDAHNQRKLRETYGYADVKIAALYQMDASTVSRLKRLLEHDNEVQMMIHEGTLSVATAIGLLELPEDERKAAIKAAIQANGKVSAEQVRKQVRNKHLADKPGEDGDEAEEADDKKTSKFSKRSAKEVRQFFVDVRTELVEPLPLLAKRIVEFFDGRCSEKALMNAMLKVAGKGE